jgi:hypothetical protein
LLDAGVDLLLHALAVGVIRKADGDLDALLLETKSGRIAVRAHRFIDCSGDADLAHFAGLPTEKGDAHGGMLFPTMMFRVGDVDAQRAGQAWATIPALMDAAEAAGRHHFPRRGAIVRPQKHGSEWRVNVTQLRDADGRATDGTDAASLTRGEVEGRRQAVAYLRFLREEVPGFERCYLLELPPQIGIRETRRLLAEHMLSAGDVLSCADFIDNIGVNAWPLEMHVAGRVEWRWPPADSRGFNQLPYRMLLPRRSAAGGITSLLVAGRCAGMTHEGQSAARVSGACFVMGQAAGAAAALSLRQGSSLHDVDGAALQRELMAQGAWLGRSTDPQIHSEVT